MEVHWYVDDADDLKVTKVERTYSDTKELVHDLAAKWWHKSGDYCTEFDFVIVKPTKHVGRYSILVETMPHFVVS